MKVISVINQKGGVGKTTTAINLAASLAISDQRVLIVDLDPQGNASTGLGLRSDEKASSVYHVLLGEIGLDGVVKATEVENLFVAPANINLAGAEVELNQAEKREYRLDEELKKMKRSYDLVVVDCPPSLSVLTLNALVASDYVLIPVQAEFYALDGLSKQLRTFKAVRATMNPRLDILGIVLTMYDKRTTIAQQVKEEIKKYFSSYLMQSVIPRNVKLCEAPSFGMPIITYAASSKGADAYIDLANEIGRKISTKKSL